MEYLFGTVEQVELELILCIRIAVVLLQLGKIQKNMKRGLIILRTAAQQSNGIHGKA